MAVTTISDTELDRRGEARIDCAAEAIKAGSLAGGLVIVAPFVPLGAAVLLLFLYLTGVTLLPTQAPVPPGAVASNEGLGWILNPLRGAAREIPVTLAIILTLVAWVAAAVVLRQCGLTSPSHASGSVFDDVHQWYVSLDARMRALGDYVPDRPSERAAYEEARGLCQNLRSELVRGGPGWALGTSYVNIWRLVHRTEEALIVVQPHEDTIADAASDELRIRGSRMQNEESLARQLRKSVETLDPAAGRFLAEESPRTGTMVVGDGASAAAPAGSNGAAGFAGGEASAGGAGSTAAAAGGPGVNVMTLVQVEAPPAPVAARDQQARERQAVAMIRSVRRAINDFRDTRRDDLVRLRNHLRATTTLTNVATFVILAVAVRALISDDTPHRASPLHDPIVAATAFYFVGAIVGLIDQLYRESQVQSATEDYGLFDARLTLTPVLSGLSAVGGVLLGAMLLGTIGTSAVIPGEVPTESRAVVSATATATSQSAAGASPAPSTTSSTTQARGPDARRGLADIFSLGSYAFGLVVAAIFGLTPRLFIDRLRSESNDYVKDLEQTSTGQTRLPERGQSTGTGSGQAAAPSSA